MDQGRTIYHQSIPYWYCIIRRDYLSTARSQQSYNIDKSTTLICGICMDVFFVSTLWSHVTSWEKINILGNSLLPPWGSVTWCSHSQELQQRNTEALNLRDGDPLPPSPTRRSCASSPINPMFYVFMAARHNSKARTCLISVVAFFLPCCMNWGGSAVSVMQSNITVVA